ncbi:MAG TPA: aminotransferase class I/II-fold pyridoxal phosphate-dependent enzyme [Egibacteraceae bacterium]|nr:aminotransferase class I/II-fold pyridoxal phosphate-dependent enzyme [Egibacteraceae bacterium]
MHRIVDVVEERSARGIAAAVSRLITTGEFKPGERLPTVRALARELRISPSTVSEAWQTLAALGAIESRGKLGTFVLDGAGARGPSRFRRITEGPGHFRLDLSTGTPDPELLPDLRPALARVGSRALTHSYLEDPVLPALEELLAATWPFAPQALTVVNGALDALDRVASHVVRFGDAVAVENPCFAPLVDLLEQLGARLVPLDLDAEGIVAASLEAALAHKPVALFLQPRAHNPTGISMSRRRAKALAAVLRGVDLTIVEDDHAGDICEAPDVSLGVHMPERTVHIRSYSKSHGPDLRIAAVGGRRDVIDAVVARRLLGAGWTSRLVQSLLVELLSDPASVDAVAAARDAYARRRAALRAALAERGVRSTLGDGINLWVEVASERSALLMLAALGIGVAPGAPFIVAPLDGEHIRVTFAEVRDGEDELADHLARAADRRPPLHRV